MLTFSLYVDNEQIIDFSTNRPGISVEKLKLESNVLRCDYKYIDKTIIDMIFNCDQYLQLAVSLDLNPEYVHSLSSIATALTKNAPDFWFFYLDPQGREEYMVYFEFDGEGVDGKIAKVKLINVVSLNPLDQDLQTLETRIEYFKSRADRMTIQTAENMEEVERVRKNIEDLRKREHELSAEVDNLTGKIADARKKLGQNNRNDDILRNSIQEKERLLAVLASITREQYANKKDVLESLAKRYEALKTDMVEELNKSMNEYIESEKKHKAALRAMLDKQAKCDIECRLFLNQTKRSNKLPRINWRN